MSKTVREPARDVPVEMEADVVVAGGGPAGLCAAVAAARLGARTVLMERYGFLGGMATAGLVNPFMNFHVAGEPIIRGVFEQWIDGMRKRGGYLDRGRKGSNIFDPEAAKFAALDLVLDAGVKLLLHSFVDNVITDAGGNRIEYLVVASKRRLAIKGSIFVDCTGDADVAALAGVPCWFGRPEDGAVQPMTLNFRMAGVDWSKVPAAGDKDGMAKFNDAFAEAKKRGILSCPRHNMLYFSCIADDEIHFNQTRIIEKNPIDPLELTAAEIEARRQVEQIVNWLVREVPGFEKARLVQTAPQIGIRESRRIEGLYELTGEDVLACRKFNDGVVRANYPVDIHNPKGEGTVLKYLPPDDWYEIPYRCLVPVRIENLLVAGRPISADHVAHSSLRVMPIAAGLGEAAGTAAAMCLKAGVRPGELSTDELVRQLVRQGQPLRSGSSGKA